MPKQLTDEYSVNIYFAGKMRDSMAELALHLWPRYPEEWHTKTIEEVLHTVKGLRNDRVGRMLRGCGLMRSTPMHCIPPSDLKYLADELLNPDK